MKRLAFLTITMMFFVSSICFAASGDKIYYEDFSSYKQGELPSGWIGGDNLAVKETKRKKVLAPFAKGGYDVTTNNIMFPKDFVVKVLMKYHYGNSGSLNIYIGNYKIIMRGPSFSSFVKDKNSESKRSNVSRGKTFSLSLKKDGIIFTLYVNGQMMLFGRYPGLEMSNIRFQSGSKFEIESITVEEL